MKVLCLGGSGGMGRYATKTEFVELTINYEYKGLYIFMEKLKRDKNRINISKLENGDIDEESISCLLYTSPSPRDRG